MSKLIVIRGPSGSGKSSVAEKLHKSCSRPTLLIHEDKVRFMFNNWKQTNHTASKMLATSMILTGLKSDYDVIYEGISNIKTYDVYFQEIFAVHKTDNFFFYLDVSFEEAIKRHKTRPEKSEFGIQEMKRWLSYASPTGYEFEQIIPESSSLEEAAKAISKAARLNIVAEG